MSTIYFLDHYRESLVDDKLAIEILARLYRDGPKTEVELKPFLTSTENELKRKLTKLFRANFIHLLPFDRWANTNLSEEILAYLGISQIATKSLLADQDLPQPDLFFLNSCIEIKSDLNTRWSKQQTALLQNLSLITELLKNRLNSEEVDRKRIIYAIIVGLDPDIHLLGEQAYCDFVFDRQKETKSKVLPNLETKWKKKFVFNCSRAIKDVHSSNKLLFYGGTDSEAETWEIFSIAWTRVLNTLMTEISDDGLQSVSRVTEDAPSKIWRSLHSWFSDVEDLSLNFLKTSGKLTHESEFMDDKRSLLQWTLWEILRRQNYTYRGDQWAKISSYATERLKDDIKPKYPSLLIPLLLHFKSELVAGEYDKISNSQKKNIGDLLDNVNTAFQERLIKKSRRKTDKQNRKK